MTDLKQKKMNKKLMVAALMNIAAMNTEGFTVDASTLQPVTTGYAVALECTQNSFGESGCKKVVDVVFEVLGYIQDLELSTQMAFGGWLNTDNNKYYFDATVICSTKEEAEALARANDQIAYFDLDNMEEIRIK